MDSSEFTSNIWSINHCLIVLVTPEAQEIYSRVRNRKWTRSVDRKFTNVSGVLVAIIFKVED
jgi:hypothetical protein